MSKAFHTFELIQSQFIETLNLTVEVYRHQVTGAMHYHLASDSDENVFMVALRTVPMDSTGVAHILEHTVLCGSEQFPVRDPFFMMIRRSLNTFMNAFTSSDWTAYPFATENAKDFDNLLRVYLDAVFFPNLDPLDFAQEGHRLEFTEMTNPESELVYKGVVFNEMKGAMSSPVSTLWQTFTEALYPTSTYHYNSGGDPKAIPDLTYEQFKAFHETHYHPSNAVFMTFGNVSAEQHQERFEALALSRFDSAIPVIKVPAEVHLTEPKVVQASYAFDEEDLTQKTHVVMGWLLGENKDPLEVLKGHLLSSVLLDNSASPMRKVLEETELAAAPSRLCGLEDSNREMVFALGLQGSEAEHQAELEALIMAELVRIVEQGVDPEQVEAALHQLELSQREIGGDHYPYGLQLMLQSLAGAMHDGDPIALLNVDLVLQQLRDDIRDPRFIPNLVQTWLLDNPHRITLVLSPDAGQAEAEEAAEKAQLKAVRQALSDQEVQTIIDQACALEARQDQADDPACLPEVTKADVPTDIKQISASFTEYQGRKMTGYQAGTNGLVYQQVILPLPDLTQQEQAIMPFFNACLPELGSGGRDYLQTQMQQAAVTGGISTKSSIRADLMQSQGYHAHYIVAGKALERHSADLAVLLNETLTQVCFDEAARVNDLVGQIRSSVDQGVTGNGHALAMSAAAQNFSPVAQWQFQQQGFAGLRAIKQTYQTLQEQGVDPLLTSFGSIQQKLMDQPLEMLVVSDASHLAQATQDLNLAWSDVAPVSAVTSLDLPATQSAVKQAWVTQTQVHFCAKAFPAVPAGHADAPKLSVLGACLRNGYLHSAIREKGGAYGGGATYNAETGSFAFYSYRDPRLLETYADFARALDWLDSTEFTQSKVDEAILNVISSMDKPSSPAGEAKKAFYQQFYGRTYDVRMAYRQEVLACTVDQLRTLAQQYFKEENASFAVLTHDKGANLLSEEGFDVYKL